MDRIGPVQQTEAYRQVQPVLDRTFGRAYPSRPDTIASMAKTGAKRLLIVTVVLGLLYALYTFITRRSSSGSSSPSSAEPREGEREDQAVSRNLIEIKPIETTFNEGADVSDSIAFIPSDHPPVIYNPSQASSNTDILASYQRVASILTQHGGHIALPRLLNGLMGNLGSSADFKKFILEQKNEQAVSQLIDFVIDTYGRHISSYPEMPSFAHDKEEVKAKIIAIMKR